MASCANCAATLGGPFCQTCGQRAIDLRRGWWVLVSEAFSEIFEVDGKVPRSLSALLLRPGELTQRWLQGERAKYSSPIRLYLFTVVVAVFAVTCGGDRVITDLAQDGYVQVARSASGDATFRIGDPETPNISMLHFETVGDAGVVHTGLDAALMDLVGDRPPESATKELFRRVLGQLPVVLLATMGFSALFLQVFWFRRYLIEHALFSLNLHTVGLLGLAIGMTVPWVGSLAGVILVLAHVFVGLHRVYGSGLPKTLLVGLLFTVTWIVGFFAMLLLSLGLELSQYGDELAAARARAAARAPATFDLQLD